MSSLKATNFAARLSPAISIAKTAGSVCRYLLQRKDMRLKTAARMTRIWLGACNSTREYRDRNASVSRSLRAPFLKRPVHFTATSGFVALGSNLELFPFRWNRNGAPGFCFDAFSSREPVPTSLENAPGETQRRFSAHRRLCLQRMRCRQ
jgi:hypothetical protein